MWQDLVDQKEKWIGGRLVDYGDSTDRALGLAKEPIETTIVDFELTDEVFGVVGKDFSCSGSRKYLGISGRGNFPVPKNGLILRGYGGWEFHIVMPDKAMDAVSDDVTCQESGE